MPCASARPAVTDRKRQAIRLDLKLKAVFNIAMFESWQRAVPILLIACSGSGSAPDAGSDVSSTQLRASDVPLNGLSSDDVAKFNAGDALFELPFRPVDGLGPLYIRTACEACHENGSRGPGLVEKMAIVEADGATAAADQSALPYGHTVRPGLAAGATTAITPPALPNVKVTIRVGPPVFGRGYMEAVDDSELVRVQAEQAARADGIHGQIARVVYASVPNPDPTFSSFQQGEIVNGRFGLKARIATLDDFAADALQGDMGLTTPMRPTELPNPDGLTDDQRAGVDLDQNHIDEAAFYVRRIAIPVRAGLSDAGAALFTQVACAACHVPTLHTRASYPISQLADIDAPIYSDLLLHDMGPALADGMTDGGGTGSSWRTAPLIGLRFSQLFLHDGRAHNVSDAVLAHAGEAAGSVAAFQALSQDDQQTLIKFVEAL